MSDLDIFRVQGILVLCVLPVALFLPRYEKARRRRMRAAHKAGG